MKKLTAEAVDGEERTTVTVRVPEDAESFELSDQEVAVLRESFAQIARGEWIDGEQLIDEIRRS